MRRRVKLIAVVLVLALLSSSCGYILYPWRRGQPHGHIDIPVLVLDILWLIPGIIPGIVALAVDFSSGAIYWEPQRRCCGQIVMNRTKAAPLVARPPVTRPTWIALRLRTREGRLLTQTAELVQPGPAHDQPLRLDLAEATRRLHPGASRQTVLELVVDGQLQASRNVWLH